MKNLRGLFYSSHSPEGSSASAGLPVIGVLLSIMLGCEDISASKTPTLVIDPAAVAFSVPDDLNEVSVRRVTMSNDGTASLIVSSIRVAEDDDITELSLLDSDDFSDIVRLEPGATRELAIAWRLRDAVSDQGRLIVTSNAGDDVVVPITTPDIDPEISVDSTPPGVFQGDVLEVVLDQSFEGIGQTALFQVRNPSLAPLSIRTICRLQPDSGDCLEDSSDELGVFRICHGHVDEESDCLEPETGQTLQNDETYQFSVRYSALEDGQMRILLESNAAQQPQFIVRIRGSVCRRLSNGDLCGRCGNGQVDPGEACDDGNVDPHDACQNQCTVPRCGDGIIREGTEACDDGNSDDTDDCTSECLIARCGDGFVHGMDEQCDDGNDDDSDSCLSTCRTAFCGDGFIQTGTEVCDDGNRIETDGCLNDCTPARCGDGIIMAFLEGCDDGNQDNSDACTASCEPARCGDGFVWAGVETCDDGNQQTEWCAPGELDCVVCDASCQRVPGATRICGDGQVQAPETCDDGNTTTETCPYGQRNCTVCDEACNERPGQVSYCGDGVIDAEHDESCDDANDNAVDGCDRCRVSLCGDGRVTPPEQCDDGNTVTEACDYGLEQCAICDAQCQITVGAARYCGDNIIDDEELCDGTPGCADDCQSILPVRGDTLYGDPCQCGSECQSGFCLSNPHNNGQGQCSQTCDPERVCPGIDRCVQTVYPAPSGNCPDPGLPFEVGQRVDICAPNETGEVCNGPADCPIDGVCVTAPNPVPAQVAVPAQCGARCDGDNQCPAGYRCDLVADQLGQDIRVCIPDIAISGCAGGNFLECAGTCPVGFNEQEIDVLTCLQPGNGIDGYCSCFCRTAADCPVGFGCDPRLFSGRVGRPHICLPVAGYICPGGNQNLCLSASCLFDQETGLNQCTAACLNDLDCPRNFRCVEIPGADDAYCEPL
ncbi:MAG: DUF4215 domain-containing protein [Myxococcota bacterium]|nr:DUF4215 domain-containing protein [Myxococcota bacterium]